MELEEAFEKVNRIRIDFFDSKYKDVHTENEMAEKYEALCTILQYIKYNSIPKKKIEDKIEEIKIAGSQINGNYYNGNIEIKVLQELLEEK